jgi:hypothetical protein
MVEFALPANSWVGVGYRRDMRSGSRTTPSSWCARPVTPARTRRLFRMRRYCRGARLHAPQFHSKGSCGAEDVGRGVGRRSRWNFGRGTELLNS